MRDREIVDRVRDATDLLALVGQAVKLRKQGSAHVGLCPFHAERSPSFQVVSNRGFYHCFGCGKHGDAFAWLMEREGMTFPEALEQLARAAGVDLPQRRERPSAEVDLETRMRSALEAAQSYFESQLARHDGARAYLRDRGYAGPFLAEAGFGMAPDGWDGLVNHLRGLNLSGELLEQAGLASRSERGTQIDFLRNRLTIPIHDARGRIVAFGGRIMGEGQPKYLNTRDTPLFHKGGTLFGFHRAKGAMKDGALVVEGYFDVLQLHQHGIHQAVAPLGTALTDEHLKALGRFTKRVILCFDGDAAGRRAMEKSLRMALPLGFEVRLLELPQGEDPDTWCLKLGGEAFKDLLRAAPDWTSFMVDRAVANKDLVRVTNRMEVFKDLLFYLPFIKNTPESRGLFSSFAHILKIPIQELDRALGTKNKSDSSDSELMKLFGNEDVTIDEHIKSLIVIAQSNGLQAIQRIPATWWESLSGAVILQNLMDAEGLIDELPEDIQACIRKIEAKANRYGTTERTINKVFLNLERSYVERELGENIRLVSDPRIQSDNELFSKLRAKNNDLLERKIEISRKIRSGA